MNEFFDAIRLWLAGVEDRFGVNPYIFATLYVTSTPPYLISMAYLVRAIRRKRHVTLMLFLTGFFFIAPALYVLAVGRNVPKIVYVVLAVMIAAGLHSAWRTLGKKLEEAESDDSLVVEEAVDSSNSVATTEDSAGAG